MGSDYTVNQGDCISSIASEHGFFWETIWNHGNNSALKHERKDPNILLPGDVVVIPDKELKEVSKETEEKHRFRRKGVPEFLSLRFLTNGKPRAGEAYNLDIDGRLSSGQLDADGCCLISIPPNAKQGILTFGDPAGGEVYHLDLGHLDPVYEDSGVRARLDNLGYLGQKPDEATIEEVAASIKRFQTDHGLSTAQGLDDDTRQRLVEEHGA